MLLVNYNIICIIIRFDHRYNVYLPAVCVIIHALLTICRRILYDVLLLRPDDVWIAILCQFNF